MAAEVTNVSPHGFWLLIEAEERFVPFKDFPWFRDASIAELTNVERPSPHHLHWPALDVDLAVESIEYPLRYPLKSRLQYSKFQRRTIARESTTPRYGSVGMNIEALLEAVRSSLMAITQPRYYDNERGFQGQLIVELSTRIPASFIQAGAIIEQEYQKRLDDHGLSIRPDIIIHEPFARARHPSRREGNFAVVELKRQASAKKSAKDLTSLAAMLDVLKYPLGIFINIASDRTHATLVPAQARGRIVVFATRLIAQEAHVTEARPI